MGFKLRVQSIGKHKGKIYVALIVCGLILTVNHHLGFSFGDTLMRWMGLSPWSNPSSGTGLHYSVLIGLVMIITGIGGAAKTYRPRYPTILRRIILGCIAFVILYPLATEKLMVAVHYNSTTVNSIAYQAGKSSCNYRLMSKEDNRATGSCNLEFYNYGKAKLVQVEPVVHYSIEDIETITLPPVTIQLLPHRKSNTAVTFGETWGNASNTSYLSGSSNNIRFNLEVVE